MSEEFTHIELDNSYIEAHKKKLDTLDQKKRFENQVYRVFGICKSIALVILALGVALFFILWGVSLLNKPEVIREIETVRDVEIPEIRVIHENVGASDINGYGLGGGNYGEGQSANMQATGSGGLTLEEELRIGDELQSISENAAADNINVEVSTFEQAFDPESLLRVTTGRTFEPPFENGLGLETDKWCYTMVVEPDSGVEVRIDLSSEAIYNSSYEIDESDFDRLKKLCR